MVKTIPGVRFIEGSATVLVVSPHSPVVDGKYENDLRTGLIAEAIQHKLDCCALINERFMKPAVDVPKSFENYLLDIFKTGHARKVPGYLEQIRNIVDTDGKTIVLWVHGIADHVALDQGQQHIADNRFSGQPQELHALIGYGQARDAKNDQPSAAFNTVSAFKDKLTGGGMTTLLTRRDSRLFRGHHKKRLNQWFNQLGYGFDKVESIQLEIREKGFRDSDKNANKAAGIIAKALSTLNAHQKTQNPG